MNNLASLAAGDSQNVHGKDSAAAKSQEGTAPSGAGNSGQNSTTQAAATKENADNSPSSFPDGMPQNIVSPLVTMKPVQVMMMDVPKQTLRNIQLQSTQDGSISLQFDVLLLPSKASQSSHQLSKQNQEEKPQYKRFLVQKEQIQNVYLCRKLKWVILKVLVASPHSEGLDPTPIPQSPLTENCSPLSQLALQLMPDLEYESSTTTSQILLEIHGSKKREFYNTLTKLLDVQEVSPDEARDMIMSQREGESSSWHDLLLTVGQPSLEKPLPTSEFLDSLDVARHKEIIDIMNKYEPGLAQNPCLYGIVTEEGSFKEWKSTKVDDEPSIRRKTYLEQYNSLNVERNILLWHTEGESVPGIDGPLLDVFREIDTDSDDEQNPLMPTERVSQSLAENPNQESSSIHPTHHANHGLDNMSQLERTTSRILISVPFKGQEGSLLQKITSGTNSNASIGGNSSGSEKRYFLIVTMYHIFLIVESSTEYDGVYKQSTELYRDDNIREDMNPIRITDIAFMRLVPSKSISFLVHRSKAQHSMSAPKNNQLEECRFFTSHADSVFHTVRRIYRSTVAQSPYLTQEDFEILPMVKPPLEYYTERPTISLSNELRLKFDHSNVLLKPVSPTLEFVSLHRSIRRNALPKIIIQKNSSAANEYLSFQLMWDSQDAQSSMDLPELASLSSPSPSLLQESNQSGPSSQQFDSAQLLIEYCRRYISVNPLRYKLESMSILPASGTLLHTVETDDLCGMRFRFESKNYSVIFSDRLQQAHDMDSIVSIEVDKDSRQAFIKVYNMNSSRKAPQVLHTFGSSTERIRKINYYPGRKSVMWKTGREQTVLTMQHCHRFVHHFEAVCSWCSHVDPFLVDVRTSYFDTVENDICHISLLRASFRSISSIERDYVPFTMNYELKNIRLAMHLYEFHDCRELHFSAHIDCKMLKMQSQKYTKQCLILCSEENMKGVYFIVEYAASQLPVSDFTIHQRGYISSIVELTNPRGNEVEIAHDGMVFSLSFGHRQDMRLFFEVMQKRYSKVPIHTKTKLGLKPVESHMEIVVQKLMEAERSGNIDELSKYWFRFQYMYMIQYRFFWRSSQMNPFGLFAKELTSSSSAASSSAGEKRRRGHEALLYYGSLKEKLKILRDLKRIESFERLYDMEKRIFERSPLIKAHFEEVLQEYESLRRKLVSQEQLRVQSPEARKLLELFTLRKRDINRVDYEYHRKNRSKSIFGKHGICATYQQNLDTSGIQLLLEDTFVRGISVEQEELPSKGELERLGQVHSHLLDFQNEIAACVQWNVLENLVNTQKRIWSFLKKHLAVEEPTSGPGNTDLYHHRELFLREHDKIFSIYRNYFSVACFTERLFSQIEQQIAKQNLKAAQSILESFESSLVEVKRLLIHLWDTFEQDSGTEQTPQTEERIEYLLLHGDRYHVQQMKLISHGFEQHESATNDVHFMQQLIDTHTALNKASRSIEQSSNYTSEDSLEGRGGIQTEQVLRITSHIRRNHTDVLTRLEKCNILRHRVQWEKDHPFVENLEEKLEQRKVITRMIKENREYDSIVNFFSPIERRLHNEIAESLKRQLSVCTAVSSSDIDKSVKKLQRYEERIDSFLLENEQLCRSLKQITENAGTSSHPSARIFTECSNYVSDWQKNVPLYKRILREMQKLSMQQNLSSYSMIRESEDASSPVHGSKSAQDRLVHDLREQFKQDLALLGRMLDEDISTEHLTSFVNEIQKLSEEEYLQKFQSSSIEGNIHQITFHIPYARAEHIYSAHPQFHQRDLHLNDFQEVWEGIQECIFFNKLEMGRLYAMLLNVPFSILEDLFYVYYESGSEFAEEEQFTMRWPDAFQISVALILNSSSGGKIQLPIFTEADISEVIQENRFNRKGQMQRIKTLLLNRAPRKKSSVPVRERAMTVRKNPASARLHSRRGGAQIDIRFKRPNASVMSIKSTNFVSRHLLNECADNCENNSAGTEDADFIDHMVDSDEDTLSELEEEEEDVVPFDLRTTLLCDSHCTRSSSSFLWNIVPKHCVVFDTHNIHNVEKKIQQAVNQLDFSCRTSYTKNRQSNMCLVYADNPEAFHLIDTVVCLLQENMTAITSNSQYNSCMSFFLNFESDSRIKTITAEYFDRRESGASSNTHNSILEAVVGTQYTDEHHLAKFIEFLLEEEYFSSFLHILMENRHLIFDNMSCLRVDGKDGSVKNARSKWVEEIGRDINKMKFFLSKDLCLQDVLGRVEHLGNSTLIVEELTRSVGVVVENTLQYFKEKFEGTEESLQEAGSEFVGISAHISTLVRYQLVPLLEMILQHALPESILFSKSTAWKLVERAATIGGQTDSNDIFMLNLRECVTTINQVSSTSASDAQKWEAFVCFSLNVRELADYMSIVLERNHLLLSPKIGAERDDSQLAPSVALIRYLHLLSPLPMRLRYESTVVPLMWDEFKRGYDIRVHHDQKTLSVDNSQMNSGGRTARRAHYRSLKDILLKKYTLRELKAAAEVAISRKNPLLATRTAAANKEYRSSTNAAQWKVKILSCDDENSDVRIGITALYHMNNGILGANESDYAWGSRSAHLYHNGQEIMYESKPTEVKAFGEGDEICVSLNKREEIGLEVRFMLNRKDMGVAFTIEEQKWNRFVGFYPAVSLCGGDSVRLMTTDEGK